MSSTPARPLAGSSLLLVGADTADPPDTTTGGDAVPAGFSLDDLPLPAVWCGRQGLVLAANGRARSGLPAWMHARIAGLVPLVVPDRLDLAQRALLAREGRVTVDLNAPRGHVRAPGVRLCIASPHGSAGFLVILEVPQGTDPAARAGLPGPSHRLLDEPDFQRTLEAADLGSWEWHAPSGRLRISRSTARLLGYGFEDLPVTHAVWRALLVDPADGPRTDDTLREYLRGRTSVFSIEHRLRARSGGTVWLKAVGRAVEWDADGRVVRLEGLHFDVTARKVAEQNLVESEARFQAMADDAPVLIWTADVTGRADYFNRQWLEFTGKSAAEQVSEGWASPVHPEDRRGLVAAHERAVVRREPFEAEFRLRRHDGEYRWVAAHARPRWLADGTFAGFIGSCKDVTERRLAAETLAINQSRFKLAFAAWGAGYFEYSRDLSRGYVDRRFAELFDLAATDFPVRSIVSHVKSTVMPEDLPRLLAAFTNVVRGEQDVMDFTYRVVTPDGRLRWIRTMGQLVSHDRHDPRHDMFAGVVFDVSDDHALQDRLSLQLAGLEAAATAIVITDRRGLVVWVNPAFTTLTGYERDEIAGRSPRMLKSGRQGDGFYHHFWRTITSGQEWAGELQNRRKDGTIYTEEMTVTPVRDADGQIAHFIAFKRDITERKRAEAELIAARNLADEASRMKSRFLAMMSHELRTPLNGLIGFTELLRSTPLDAEQADYVATMRASSETLLAVINDILDYSKVEAGRLDLESASFPVRDVIRDTVRLFTPRAREKGIALDCEIAPEVPAAMIGDATRLRQVLANLVGNAVKFTEEGRVHVRADLVPADRLRIVVADTGIGIPADRLGRLFQPFSQADAAVSRKYGGTGLGLSIAASLASLMGGTLTAASVPGAGSTFTVEVPFAPAADQPLPEAPEAPDLSVSFARRHPMTILVVEDNAVNQKLACATLRRLGYAPEVVDSGTAGVERAARGGIGCILMDVQMPGMDGFEATRRIRAATGGDGIYIAAMTAHTLEGDAQRCLDEGMNDYVAKPFRMEQLTAALKRGHAWLTARGYERPPA